MDQPVYRPVSKESDSASDPEEKPPKNEVSLHEARAEAEKKGVIWRALLIGGVIIVALVVMIAVLLSYLCVAHQCMRSTTNRRFLFSTAPLGKTLTISQISSHVAPLAVPLVMGLFSYQLAAQWLKASAHSGHNRPSPMQLGLVLSIINGAGLMNLYNGVRYVFTKDKSRKNIPAALMLRQSVFFLTVILLVSYIITGADAWFHATSSSITFVSITPFTPSSSNSNQIAFGRGINSTMCQIAQTANDPYNTTQSTCGMQNDGAAGSDMLTRSEGLRALSNSSFSNRVEYADDQTAIMVPTSLPPNITYAGTTIGVQSNCQSITRDCIFSDPIGGYGPEAFLNLDCNKPGKLFNKTQFIQQDFPGWAIDSQGQAQYGYQISTNPYHAAAVIQSVAYYIPNSQDVFINNTGWFIHGSSGAWNVVYCNVSVLDVSYIYSSSTNSYTVTKSTLVPVQLVPPVATFGMENPATIPAQIQITIDGVGITGAGLTYEDTYGLELSRQVLARSSALYEPVEATNVSMESTTIGSNIDLVPLAVLVVSQLFFGLLTLAILFNIIVFARVPFVRLASAYLNDPFTVVHALYGPKNPSSTWEDDALIKFGTESNSDRLSAGTVNYAGQNEYIFAVRKHNVIDASAGI